MQELTPEEKTEERRAEKWIIEHKKDITKKFADIQQFPADSEPVSIFMAGTPGAGKTEYSKHLNKEFEVKAVRIDADEIRSMINGYTGANSYVFQKACTTAVNNLFGHVLNRGQNLILDATFAYENSLENVERSLAKKRKVHIYFIYQTPIKAWEITKAREAKEGRRVFKDIFVDAYFKSRQNVAKVKKKYGNKVQLNLVIKEYEQTGSEKTKLNIDSIDGHLEKVYTMEELGRIIR